MKKKLLSVLLCLCMVMGLLPTTALAAGEHSHPICGANCTDDEKHSSDQTWRGVSNLSQITSAGNYYLTTDVTLTSTWRPADGTVLCLNGHTITAADDVVAIQVNSGATFTLTDCSTKKSYGYWDGESYMISNTTPSVTTYDIIVGGIITHSSSSNCGVLVYGGTFNMHGGSITGNTNTNTTSGGVYVYDGTFNMSGGTITGNRAEFGGGVYITQTKNGTATFTMSGGSITNNTATSKGGGVYVAGGTFTMSGGSITNNTAKSKGGGVYVADGTFTMSGGKISDNQMIDNSSAIDTGGGGVYVSGGTFEMSGDASITGNTSKSYAGGGGGVYVYSGKFTMSGGTIGGTAAGAANTAEYGDGGGVYVGTGGNFTMSETASITGNTATFKGGGVYVYTGTFKMSGTASITGNNTASGNKIDYGGGGVYVYNGTFEMSETASITGNTATGNGGGVYIMKNKNGTATFTMSGGTIGGIATGAANTAQSGGGVYVSGGAFEMSETASITGNTATSKGGGVYVNGTFEMSGDASITGNTAKSSGGGVCVSSGKFTMSGGKISDNQMIASSGAIDTGGGGVCVYSGTFTMSGDASITGNTASKRPGGGVYVYNGTFEMSETASITGNTATGSDGYGNGGGVYVEGGAFNMQGGSITGNTATENGGGVYVDSNGSAAMTVSGGVNITGNKKGDDANNVYLYNYNNTVKTITVAGALEGASIGVTTGTAPTNSTDVKFATSASETDISGYKNRFTPDAGSNYLVVYNEGDKSLYLKKHQHRWTYNPNSTNDTITANCAGCSTTETLTISASNTTYDGTAKPATLSDQSGFASKLKTVQVNYQKKTGDSTYDTATTTAPTDAGTYKASITAGTGESAATASVEYTITPKTLTDVAIAAIDDQPFNNGNEIKPTVTVTSSQTVGSYSLVEDTDYTVAYADNTAVGTATVTVTAKAGGNYTFSPAVTQNFTITSAAIPDAVKNAITGYTGTYDGNPHNAVVIGAEADGYTVQYSDDENGTYNADMPQVTNVSDSTTVWVEISRANYTPVKKSVTVTVSKATQNTLTVTGDTTVTYGQTLTLSSTGGSGSGAVTYEIVSGGTGAATIEGTVLTPTKAGTVQVKAVKAADSNYNQTESTSVIITITKAAGSLTAPTAKTGLVYNGSAQELIDTGSGTGGDIKYSLDGVNWDTAVPKGTNADTYTVYYKLVGDANHNDVTGDSLKLDVTIGAKPLTLHSATATGREYAAGNNNVAISAVTFNEAAPVPTLGSGFTASGVMDTDAAGTEKSVTVTVVLTDTNYSLANNTINTTVDISKVNHPTYNTAQTDTTYAIRTVAGEKTYELPCSDLLGVTYTVTGKTTANIVDTADPTISGNTLTYTSKEGGDEGSQDTITIKISSTNYNDITLTLTVEASNKTNVTISGLSAATGLTYNGSAQTGYTGTPSYAPAWTGTPVVTYYLSDGTTKTTEDNSGSAGEGLAPKNAGNYKVTISIPDEDTTYTGSVTLDFTINKAAGSVTAPTAKTLTYTGTGQVLINAGSSNTGTIKYNVDGGAYDTGLPNKTNAGTYTVSYMVVGDANHEDVAAATVSVTIAKATPTGAPAYTAITTGGKTLADAALTVGAITPAGTIVWDQGDSTSVSANTAYSWTFTPSDTTNYNTLTGSITPYVVSYSGGGSYTPPTYKVESAVSKDTDGSVSFSKGSAKKGDTVTITVTPDRYYKVDGVTVKDKNGKEIAVTDNGDGTFTFKMPDSKVTVEPAFSWDNPFTDVAEDTYYAPAVEWALKNELTSGTGDGTTFSPNTGCTRAQIVTFLWRAAGCPEPAGMSSFTDVSADAYYAKAVAWAAEQGITSGTGDGKFSPDATCTRSQSMTFLYHAAGSPEVADGIAFSDVTADSYYAAAVAWATQNGVTNGTGDGTTFSPGAGCTRGQIMTFLYRWLVK